MRLFTVRLACMAILLANCMQHYSLLASMQYCWRVPQSLPFVFSHQDLEVFSWVEMSVLYVFVCAIACKRV
jgi:hypothetical protein